MQNEQSEQQATTSKRTCEIEEDRMKKKACKRETRLGDLLNKIRWNKNVKTNSDSGSKVKKMQVKWKRFDFEMQQFKAGSQAKRRRRN